LAAPFIRHFFIDKAGSRLGAAGFFMINAALLGLKLIVLPFMWQLFN